MASTTYLQHALKWAVFTNEVRLDGETVTKRHHFASIGNMVRNAGQLPQPQAVPSQKGCGSCSAATVPART